MTEIAQELKELCDAASFTIADMAMWCDQHRSAMRQWMQGDHAPHPVNLKNMRPRLELLRQILKESNKLPVPITVRLYQRAEYVKQVRDYALKKISKSGTSKRRV